MTHTGGRSLIGKCQYASELVESSHAVRSRHLFTGPFQELKAHGNLPYAHYTVGICHLRQSTGKGIRSGRREDNTCEPAFVLADKLLPSKHYKLSIPQHLTPKDTSIGAARNVCERCRCFRPGCNLDAQLTDGSVHEIPKLSCHCLSDISVAQCPVN